MFVNVELNSLWDGNSLSRFGSLPDGTRQVVFVDHGNGSLEPKDVSRERELGMSLSY